MPETIAVSAAGLQVVMSDGSLWKVIGNQALPRTASTVIGATATGAQNTAAVAAPRQMVATADGRWIFLLSTSGLQGGAGMGYLYDALSDTWITSSRLFNTPIQGYFGPIAPAADGGYYLAGGLILNSALSVVGGAERAGLVQTGIGTALRNVASVASVDSTTLVRLTLPVRANITATTTDDARPTLELIDLNSNTASLAGVGPENPAFTALGTTRYNIPPHQLVVDSKGNAYALTLSGLSFIPMTLGPTQAKPAIAAGTRAIVNSSDNSTNYKPGSFITVTGANLAGAATADQLPLPKVLGGSCVVFNDVALPLLETAPGRISAQIPATVRSGLNVVQVRSLATAQSSDAVIVTVQKP
ncbi:MAG: hypothetical protein NTY38_16265 [Acidobacteria bacterium]|nr:hypothetical protein [Acidobacteriota bacterium]